MNNNKNEQIKNNLNKLNNLCQKISNDSNPNNIDILENTNLIINKLVDQNISKHDIADDDSLESLDVDIDKSESNNCNTTIQKCSDTNLHNANKDDIDNGGELDLESNSDDDLIQKSSDDVWNTIQYSHTIPNLFDVQNEKTISSNQN